MTIYWKQGDPADAKANQEKARDVLRAFNMVNHPEVDTHDDTPVHWEDTVGARIAAESAAERDGVSYNAAFDAIRRGAFDKSEQNTARSEDLTGGSEGSDDPEEGGV